MYELEASLVIQAHFRNKLFIFLSDPILNNVGHLGFMIHKKGYAERIIKRLSI